MDFYCSWHHSSAFVYDLLPCLSTHTQREYDFLRWSIALGSWVVRLSWQPVGSIVLKLSNCIAHIFFGIYRFLVLCEDQTSIFWWGYVIISIWWRVFGWSAILENKQKHYSILFYFIFFPLSQAYCFACWSRCLSNWSWPQNTLKLKMINMYK